MRVFLNPVTGSLDMVLSTLDELKDIPSYPTTVGMYVLEYDQASDTFTWVIPSSGASVGTQEVQFSDGAGGFVTHAMIWEGSNSSLSPTTSNTRSLGATSRLWANVTATKHTAISGALNGFQFTGSGVTAKVTAQAGPGDGISLWANSAQKKINIAISKGMVVTDGALLSTSEAAIDVTLDLVGKSTMRFAGATAATISAFSTPLEGMMTRVTTTDATFTSVGIWFYEGARWNKLKTFSAQSFSFTRNNNDFLQEGSATYVSVSKIIFAGSSRLGFPTAIEANVWNDGGTSVSIEVFDVTNSLQIAETTGIASGSDVNLQNLGALANIPAGSAVFEIRLLQLGGGMGDNAKISSLTIR